MINYFVAFYTLPTPFGWFVTRQTSHRNDQQNQQQEQSQNADSAKNYSSGKTSPLKVGGSKLTNFLLPKSTKVKGFQSSTSTNINIPG